MEDRKGDKLDRFLDKLDQAISSEDVWVGLIVVFVITMFAIFY